MLRSAPDTIRGILLIDRGIGAHPWVAGLYEELSLYLCAAGITTLQIAASDLAPSRNTRTAQFAANEILAGIDALRERGISHIALVIAASSSARPRLQASDLMFSELVESLMMVPQTGVAIAERLSGLVELVQVAVESVVGTASLILRHEATYREPLCVVRKIGEHWGHEGETGGEGARLDITIGTKLDTHAATRIMSSLYRWIAEVLPAEKLLDAHADAACAGVDAGSDQESITPWRAHWHDQICRLDEQWERILNELEERVSWRAKEVRAELPSVSGTGLLREVSRVWRYLDMQARRELLGACKVALTPPSSCVADSPPSDSYLSVQGI
jgi:hypothetical protein